MLSSGDPFEEILVAKGVILRYQLDQARELQKATHGDLGKIIVALGFTTEFYVTLARAKEYGLQFFDFNKHKVDPAAVRLVPKELLKQHCVLPVMRQENRLYVAVSNLRTVDEALDDIHDALSIVNPGIVPQAILSVEADVIRAISQWCDDKQV